MATITNELKQHVADNEHIQEVYFDAAGNHYFHNYDLGGRKYGRIAKDFQAGLSDEEASAPFLITETISRAEILGWEWPEPEQPTQIQESTEGPTEQPKEESTEETPTT